MSTFDSYGWTPFHAAAFKGYSLEKFILDDRSKLELTTTDELGSTPLLLAVMSGNINTVETLINYGAKVSAKNSQDHGVIELACLKLDIPMLQYLLETISNDTLPVISHLIKFITHRQSDQASRASEALCQILSIYNQSQDTNTLTIDQFLQNGLVEAVVKVIQSYQGNECKRLVLLVLLEVICYQTVRDQFIVDGLEHLILLLKPPSTPRLATVGFKVIDSLITEPNGYSQKIFQAGIISDLNRIIQWSRPSRHTEEINEKETNQDNTDSDEDFDEKREALEKEKKLKAEWSQFDLLCQVMKVMNHLVEINISYQTAIVKEHECLSGIVALFSIHNCRKLTVQLTHCVSKLAANNKIIQNQFKELEVDDFLIILIRSKDQHLQLLATEAIYRLTQNNTDYSDYLVDKESHKPLLMMLRKAGRNVETNEKAAKTLWNFVGTNQAKKVEMADLMNVEKLIDFLQMNSETLQLIASEALSVISGGPLSRRDYIGKLNGIAPLVKLMHSSNSQIVMGCIKTLRQMCIGIGWLPHKRNQQLVMITRGLYTLVGLMRFCEDELVQAEAAFTVACSVMRNEDSILELQAHPKFNYVYVLDKLYSEDRQVRLLTCAALAAFAYNNIAEQKQIAMCGGVRFDCIRPFLDSSDEFERCMGSFHLVILARVIPDEELAVSTALGLKTLMTTLGNSKDPNLQEYACCCIARLCHTRAGVAEGLISLNAVDILCCLILSYVEAVRGTASIAIQYLSHFPDSRRQILRKCRRDPYLMKAVKFYNSPNTIDTQFVEVWRHYERVGLPKINKTRPPLSTRQEYNIFQDYDARQLTIFSTNFSTDDVAPMTGRMILPKLPPIEQNIHNEEKNNVINNMEEDNKDAEDFDAMQLNDKNSLFEETQLNLTT